MNKRFSALAYAESLANGTDSRTIKTPAFAAEKRASRGIEFVAQFPSIALSDVHVALAYYFDHIDEIREEMRVEREVVETFRRDHKSLLEEKLRQAGIRQAATAL
jgi:hypothetical protein